MLRSCQLILHTYCDLVQPCCIYNQPEFYSVVAIGEVDFWHFLKSSFHGYQHWNQHLLTENKYKYIKKNTQKITHTGIHIRKLSLSQYTIIYSVLARIWKQNGTDGGHLSTWHAKCSVDSQICRFVFIHLVYTALYGGSQLQCLLHVEMALVTFIIKISSGHLAFLRQ